MMIAQDFDLILQDSLVYGRSHLSCGKVADYIPELAKADPSHLGICLMLPDGTVCHAGSWKIPFTMQSIAKTFSLILALKTVGYEKVFSKVGMEPTGDCFDSIVQLETKQLPPFNPMINAGAIVTVSCIELPNPFGAFLELVRQLCFNDTIRLNEQVYLSEKRTGLRNRSIAYLLQSDHILEGDPEQVLDRYFRMCSVEVTTEDLARYALILANDGTDPVTGEEMIEEWIVRIVKTLMLTCGMYDESGEFAVKTGIPSKSGVGGGIVAATEQGMGIATYGPVLNKKGNSVGGIHMLEYLSRKLNLHYLANKTYTAV
ncbi:glutaminase A [Faecalispora anaeroviscerum]|uniref:glutaminase A n=1 Tax=Faecalispora anaeroviscerum TaxID=2991836 RepID=UPI0024B8814E|nr:glutaminase A [Faecalispora anaeroviscerum]